MLGVFEDVLNNGVEGAVRSTSGAETEGVDLDSVGSCSGWNVGMEGDFRSPEFFLESVFGGDPDVRVVLRFSRFCDLDGETEVSRSLVQAN